MLSALCYHSFRNQFCYEACLIITDSLLKAFLSGICLNVCQTVKSYSTSFPMWMSLRFITGLFTSSAYGVTYTYVLELLTERRRMLLGVINSITFGIGTMYLSLLAYLFNDWRSLARAIAITPGKFIEKMGQGHCCPDKSVGPNQKTSGPSRTAFRVTMDC